MDLLLPYCHNTASCGASELASRIGSIIPETYESENINRAMMALRGSGINMMPEYIEMLFFSLSNSLNNLTSYNSVAKWNSVVQMLECSQIMQRPIRLGPGTDSTTMAVMERLFRTAFSFLKRRYSFSDSREERVAHEKNLKLISWVLSSGHDPDAPLVVQEKQWTPLQLAAREGKYQSLSNCWMRKPIQT